MTILEKNNWKCPIKSCEKRNRIGVRNGSYKLGIRTVREEEYKSKWGHIHTISAARGLFKDTEIKRNQSNRHNNLSNILETAKIM